MGNPGIILLSGALNGFLTVALGAFAAHGLKEKLEPALLTTFQTGVTYHGLHSLALLLTGLLALQLDSNKIRWAGWFFLAGIFLFSGSLYLLAVTGSRSLGIVTPFGGIAFLAGWTSLALATWDISKRDNK